ncbi:hypothetical protein B0H21DRAFT_694320 [Amylocystis lapponica]|nr:hypothetical protein B0H21DRAFT_694320 [Amylocystis lapponica]
MDKLKKPQYSASVAGPSSPTSRTMMYARTVVASSANPKAATTVDTAVRVPAVVRPVSTAEHYWAARALTAEALLSVRTAHHREVHAIAAEGEEKCTRELAALQRVHDRWHAKVERLVIVLLACLVAFVSAVIYILSRGHARSPASRWSVPSHFTIPILSPFASVVEHETSVFSTKVITIVCLALSCLAYACFRYWLTHGTPR